MRVPGLSARFRRSDSTVEHGQMFADAKASTTPHTNRLGPTEICGPTGRQPAKCRCCFDPDHIAADPSENWLTLNQQQRKASRPIKNGGRTISADGVQPRSVVTVLKHGPSPSPTRPATPSSHHRRSRRALPSRRPSLSKQLMACGVQSRSEVTVIKHGPSADQLTPPTRPPAPRTRKSCPKSRTEPFKTTTTAGMNSS